MDVLSVATFIVPDWGEKSQLWHRVVVPARQAAYAGGPVRQSYARVNYIPQSGTMNLAQEGLNGGFDSMAFIEKIPFFITYKIFFKLLSYNLHGSGPWILAKYGKE